MPVISAALDFNEEDLYLDLRQTLNVPLYLKCEGFNFAGSIKLKAAKAMVDAAEAEGRLTPESTIIESSSGNLGVALAIAATSRGYSFVCVTDSRCNLATRQMMETLGADVHIINQPHSTEGLLGARIHHIRKLCTDNPHYLWLNQYANPNAWKAHYLTTAPAIARHFPHLDVLFIGAGTTGTLMGCARYFADHHPATQIVAIDAEGSTTFGAPPARRMIPGLGTSITPPLLDTRYIHHTMYVSEPDTIRACHGLARHGFLLGGSSGTVVHAATAYLKENHCGDADIKAVAIAPDLGERYLDTIYQTNWVHDLYGPYTLGTSEVPVGHGSL
jgi:cysteine synthase A